MELDEPLTSFPFFQDLSSVARERLRSELRVVEAAAGRVLVNRGDEVSGAYLVVEGCLRVYTINESGRQATLYWVESSESCILALRCVFSSVAYPAWVEAEQDTRMLVLPAATFRQLFKEEEAMQRYVFDTLSARVFSLMSSLEEVFGSDLRSRLVALLLKRSDAQGRVAASHESIAAHLGTAREVVTRILRELEAKGLVQRRRAMVQVVDAAKLRAWGASA